jgi:hypothetical protein
LQPLWRRRPLRRTCRRPVKCAAADRALKQMPAANILGARIIARTARETSSEYPKRNGRSHVEQQFESAVLPKAE